MNNAPIPANAVKYTPPLDHTAVLAVHNKLTVLLMHAIEKDAAEPDEVKDDLFAEDRQWVISLRSVRWWDVQDVVEKL